MPGAPPAQGQGSRGAAPRRVIPPPTPLHTRPLVCTRHSPVYTSIHPLSSSLASHIPRAYTHTRAGLPPPRNTIPHPTPRLAHPQPYRGRRWPTGRKPPTKGGTRGGRQLGWRPQEPGPPCMLMNSLISLPTTLLPGRRLLRGFLHCPASRAAREGDTARGFAWDRGPGSLASPSLVPQGPSPAAHHVLSVVAALAIPGSGPPPVTSLCSSRRKLPGARRGRDCGPQTGHRSGWRAGRREGSPPGGNRTGRHSALHREERGSRGRKIKVSPNVCKM